MEKFINLAARVLLSHIFILAGINKISGYAGTQGYMESMGVPGMLLPLVIILEVAGSGFQCRGFRHIFSGRPVP